MSTVTKLTDDGAVVQVPLLTLKDLADIEAKYRATELIIHGGERRRARRDIADQAFELLLDTARAGLAAHVARPLPDRELLSRKITAFAQAYHGAMANQMHPDHRRDAWMEVYRLLDDIYGGSDKSSGSVAPDGGTE